MNRFVLAGVVVIGVLVALVIGGALWLHLNRPDASATFVSQGTQLIGLVTLAAGTFYGLSRLNQGVQEVRTQTNGTNTELRGQVAALTAELAATRELHAAATGSVPASSALSTPAVIPPTPSVQHPAAQPDPEQPG